MLLVRSFLPQRCTLQVRQTRPKTHQKCPERCDDNEYLVPRLYRLYDDGVPAERQVDFPH